MKKMISSGPAGDPVKGRSLFDRTCKQCHVLYGEGGKVGPELTGSNRADLDYLLSNILDPSAEVGADYRAATVKTTDGRILSGILRRENPGTITLITENDRVVMAEEDVDKIRKADLSMMPEGLLSALSEVEQRDLVAYLRSPVQVQGVSFFNGKDLAGWEGDLTVWSVEDGEIVGHGPVKKNQFLWSTIPVGDFRLIIDVKLTPDANNSGIQFRSKRGKDNHAVGYQADVGRGVWGKLYHEHGRKMLWGKPGDQHVKPGEWNTYEILAVGGRIRTAINGMTCVDFEDPTPDLKGLVALQVHSGRKKLEVRFRNLQLEHRPNFELKTVTDGGK